jgi:hypothetical protein
MYPKPLLQKWIINLLILLGCAFTIVSAYPGFMSFDSLDQYTQAKNNVYLDWHPPFMAWLWNKFIHIKDGPEIMLVLFNFLYWFSIWVIALKIRNFGLSLLFIALALSPSLINFIGVIWKDTFLFSLLFLQCAILFAFKDVKIQSYKRHLILASIIIINFVAILLRHNAITALVPLLILSFVVLYGKKRIFISIIAGFLVAIALFFAGQKVNNTLCNNKHLHPEQQLMIFDLMGISQATNQNLMPEYLKDKLPLDSITRYYFYSSGGMYVIFSMHCNTSDPVKLKLLREAWISAIKENPKELLKHKYLVFEYLQSHSSLVTYNAIDPNIYGIALKPNPIRNLFISYTEGEFAKAFYKAKYYTWICLVTMIMSLVFIRKNSSFIYPFFISLSGLLYSLTYFLLSPTSDLRYNYWTIGAALISSIFFLNSFLNYKQKT